MYNGQKNSSFQIGQIKQNKIVASDYSRPRKGSYCQYKQQKQTVNSMAPFSAQKQDFTNIKRSSLGFYDHSRISNSDMQSRLQKYTSKQFHQNQTTIKSSYRDSNLNFKIKNRDDEEYLALPKSYDTERFYQTYDTSNHKHFEVHRDRMPTDGLMKKQPKRLNKYMNQNYQNQPIYEKVYEKNSFAKEQPFDSKNYQTDHINLKYQDNRNEKSSKNQNDGKKQLNDLYFKSYRQNILQVQRLQDFGNQKPYLKAQKPHYQMDQNRRNQRNFTINQRQREREREKAQPIDKYFQQVQTSNRLPSKSYYREKNTSIPNENEIQQKYNKVRQQRNYDLQNDGKIIGTPNRLKYNEDQKLQKNLSSSRRDLLISKSKILRQKMNELSADKKVVGSSSNSHHDENKNQSYQERLQRLKNNKNRVYESPFKQTIRSSNFPMRCSTNTQIIEKPNNLQKKELKTQKPIAIYENRQNFKEQPNHDRKVQGYGPHENDCMDRISLLNNKINEKISSIISSYGRPSH